MSRPIMMAETGLALLFSGLVESTRWSPPHAKDRSNVQ
jgi:hypothetical protein